MDSLRIINVGLLEGKSNWNSWKYKISICLRGIPGALDVIEGNLVTPSMPSRSATADERAAYDVAVEKFNRADCSALTVLSTNMTEETLQKIMRLTKAREVWLELHKLFDGVSEDKIYNICMEFFSVKKDSEDDIATHVSKLKNLWSGLKQEMAKDVVNNSELPDLFLLCKILDTLPDNYFSFKSSWMLMSKYDRTIDNLTNQLCAYERALGNKVDESSGQEALVFDSSKNTSQTGNSTETKKKKKLICNYCKKPNHTIKICRKWIADGRPPKQNNKHDNNTNMVLLTVTSTVMSSECRTNDWYVDNGATSHVSNDRSSFRNFQPFLTTHSVTTANGEKIKAIGKGEMDVEAAVNGKWHKITLAGVWYVPEIQKNLFSVLAAQDKHL